MVIKLSTKYSEELVNKIMKMLKSCDSCTMLEFANAFGKKYSQSSNGWEKLRLHLIYMVHEGLIEERHFGKNAKDWNRIVDYVPEGHNK